MAMAAAMASSFGMNDSDISLICVAAWNTPTKRHVINATSSSGAASSSVIVSAWMPMVITIAGDIRALFLMLLLLLLVETGGERAHHQRPAVHQLFYQAEDGIRDEHGRQHHHAHGHQHAGDHQIDDHEGNEYEEADLEGRLELTGGE